MYPIIICEDDSSQLQQMETLIKNFIMFHDYSFKLDFTTQNPRDLILYLDQEKPRKGIYFLDVDLNSDKNGLDMAEAIRDYDPYAKIIFVTSFVDYAPKTIERKIEPLAYIIKKNVHKMRDDIYEVLELAYQRLNDIQKGNYINFTFEANRIIYNIDIETIILIETTEIPHRLRMITTETTSEKDAYYFYSSLNKISNQYQDDFIRISRPILVNPNTIKYIDKSNKIIRFIHDMERPFSIKYQNRIFTQLNRV